jgi:hypothetical protein
MEGERHSGLPGGGEGEAGVVVESEVAAGTAYQLHFITMDPGALFLPMQLHGDMVFYVHSGR